MSRPFMPWLAGFLMISCVWLWTYGRVNHPETVMFVRADHRASPMDMPNWYFRALEKGEHYVEIGPQRLVMDEKTGEKARQRKHKASAVRGYW